MPHLAVVLIVQKTPQVIAVGVLGVPAKRELDFERDLHLRLRTTLNEFD